jgi:hypothetical protein
MVPDHRCTWFCRLLYLALSLLDVLQYGVQTRTIIYISKASIPDWEIHVSLPIPSSPTACIKYWCSSCCGSSSTVHYEVEPVFFDKVIFYLHIHLCCCWWTCVEVGVSLNKGILGFEKQHREEWSSCHEERRVKCMFWVFKMAILPRLSRDMKRYGIRLVSENNYMQSGILCCSF